MKIENDRTSESRTAVTGLANEVTRCRRLSQHANASNAQSLEMTFILLACIGMHLATKQLRVDHQFLIDQALNLTGAPSAAEVDSTTSMKTRI